jgi:predicted nucleic acid-binding protein
VNVVDSSAWLEYFADGPNAGCFAVPVQAVQKLIVPTITIFEVFKRVYQQRGRNMAFRAVAQMRLGRVVDLDRKIAVAAARVGLAHKLALADSVVLATARAWDATLWTQDDDFEGIRSVRYSAKHI